MIKKTKQAGEIRDPVCEGGQREVLLSHALALLHSLSSYWLYYLSLSLSLSLSVPLISCTPISACLLAAVCEPSSH